MGLLQIVGSGVLKATEKAGKYSEIPGRHKAFTEDTATALGMGQER